MKKGLQEKVITPGYNRRTNLFITLFWPRKNGYIFNKFEKRRSKEFKLHLSNLLQYVKRRKAKRVILFLDHALCHKTKAVKRLIRRYKIFRVIFLPKKAPELNPAERIINSPLKAFVSTNHSYSNIDEVNRTVTYFLRNHRKNLCT